MPPTPSPEAVVVAGRVVLATGLAVVLAFRLGLEFPQVAAATAYAVLFQYPHTAFQKAVERLAGRCLGIGIGLVIVSTCGGRPLLALGLEAVALLGLYYVHFSGRLAYTFLQSGIYLSTVTLVGAADPARAWPAAGGLVAALCLGMAVALPINWLLGVEASLTIHPGGRPLWPLNADWLNHAAMLAATVLLTEAAAWWVALPLSQSITSVLMLSTAADRDAILRKGRDRVLGGLAGGLWVVAGVLLLHRLPGLPVFLAVYALGMFVAVHWALTSRDHAYGGYQMGLVIALAFVAEPHVAGSRDPVGQRFEGIFLGLVVSVVVAELWPGGGFRPRPAVNPGNPATPAVDARPG